MGGASSVEKRSKENDDDVEFFATVPAADIAYTIHKNPSTNYTTSTSCILKIVAINDVYDIQLLSNYATCKDLEKQNGGDLVIGILAGDFVSPSLLSSLDKGNGMVDCMNVAGIDYVCIGNHEGDIAFTHLHDRIKQSKFKWVNSNMPTMSLPPSIGKLPEYVILEVNGGGQMRRIALLGLMTEDPHILRPGAFGGCAVEPLIPTALRLYEYLTTEEQVDIVIPITHQLMTLDRDLARTGKFPLILGGHDHEPFLETISGSTIVKSGMNAKLISTCTVAWPDANAISPIISVDVDDALRFPPKKELVALVNEHNEVIRELEASMLCQIPEGLELSSKNIRLQPSSVGTFLCTAVRNALGTDCTLLNSGAIRANRSYAGEECFTYAHLKTELPFSTDMVVVQLPGRVISSMISYSREFALRSPPVSRGGYLQSDDGIAWDSSTNTVTAIKRKPVDADAMYVTAIPWALLDGLDAVVPLLEYKAMDSNLSNVSEDSGISLKDVVVACFSKMLLYQMVHSERFEDIDTDGDGLISKDELTAIARKKFGTTGGISAKVISNLFDVADEDGSGFISTSELVAVFISAMASLNEMSPVTNLEAFTDSIQNELGVSMPRDVIKKEVDRVDGNVDGKLSTLELETYECDLVKAFSNKVNDQE